MAKGHTTEVQVHRRNVPILSRDLRSTGALLLILAAVVLACGILLLILNELRLGAALSFASIGTTGLAVAVRLRRHEWVQSTRQNNLVARLGHIERGASLSQMPKPAEPKEKLVARDPTQEPTATKRPKVAEPLAVSEPAIGRGAAHSPIDVSRETVLASMLDSTLQAERQKIAVILPPTLSEYLSANVITLVPGLSLPTIKSLRPSLLYIDERAFMQGVWTGADTSAGEQLSEELLTVMRWARGNDCLVLGRPASGPLAVNSRTIRSLYQSFAPVDLGPQDAGITLPSTLGLINDMANATPAKEGRR